MSNFKRNSRFILRIKIKGCETVLTALKTSVCSNDTCQMLL